MIAWSVKHKSILALLTGLFMILGIYAYIVMERQENPEVTSPVASVTCIYPGASPEDIEKLIVKPIEDKIDTIAGIKKLDSYSVDSAGVIQITLKDMSDSEINKKWDKLREKIDEIKPELPSDAQAPVIKTDFSSSYGLILGLSGADNTNQEMADVARQMKNIFSGDSDVKAVDIMGDEKQQIEIDLNMSKLQQYGISPAAVATQLGARNINIPGGNLELTGTKIPVQVSGEYKSMEEIKNTIVSVSTDSGTPVYLKNVAEVLQTPVKPEKQVSVNGRQGVLIGVKYAVGINILNVEKRLQDKIHEFEKTKLYVGMELTELNNQAGFVKGSIDMFADNLIEGILLVFVVVLLAMGVRSAAVVSIPIPVICIFVFGYMYLTRIPLHQVAVASLMISLSLMVANGIVANDNIHVYLAKGETLTNACISGVKEVGIPILTSSLTTVASFLPLAMMNGDAGKFVKTLPILVSVALAGSYITSLTIVPALGHLLYRQQTKDKPVKTEPSKFTVWKQKIEEKLHLKVFLVKGKETYGRLLNFSLKKPRAILLFFAALLVVSFLVVPTLSVQLFPPVERDQYVLNVTTQDGSTLEKTLDQCKKVGAVLKKEKSIQSFASTAGDGFMKYYVTFEPEQQATNKAQFLINGTREEAAAVEKKILKEVPGVSTTIKYLEISLPLTYPIQVRISGDDIQQLRSIAAKIEDRCRNVPGTRNIEDNYGDNSYRLNVNVNEEKANLVGITNYDVASTVRMAVNGLEILKMKQKDLEKDSLPVIAKISDKDKTSREILNTIFLTSQVTGKNVPLTQIATIQTQSSLNQIIRRNSRRTITIGSYVEEGYNTEAVMENVEKSMEGLPLPDGYTLEYGGESENSSDAFSSMTMPTIIAVILIYIILVFQFGDLLEPLIIMGTIPLSFIGIIWGLKWMGYPIGFMALLGAISLMGVVVNNGIVLLDYIKVLIPESKSNQDAIVKACETRMRPIMIGMITTVFSLLPLMISGGPLWAPMATAVIFGIILSTVLTMIVIPCAYALIASRRVK
ncbi:efflux RND transporter permease subunit [Clostridium boliviensis]|uniref:Efflux RND transporter permease subunit n=1 Tax=Clostridium boliviensis TaxID=318465 RepID=A0ABU4GM17_9CLOT|nr:efflux RND transporter permease subunit [Clostridium boliviensis]MDW2798650.1 efflux RND transporter permease subunit [Clostridium boliviensis]